MSDTIPHFDKLRGSENFTLWASTLKSHLKAKKLHDYILGDALASITDKTENKEDITANDALVGTIIFENVTDQIKFYLRNCESAFSKMKKLKELYEVEESAYYGMYLKRIYDLKAKNINDTLTTINEITELFKLLKKSAMEPSNIINFIINYV